MADYHIDPSQEIPEADHLEQQTPLDPQRLTATETMAAGAETLAEANDADRWEQHTAVNGVGEDDYPHEAEEPGRP